MMKSPALVRCPDRFAATRLKKSPPDLAGRIPRVARLLALALKCQRLLERGELTVPPLSWLS